MGTDSGLAHRFSDGSWEVFDEDNSELPDNWVESLVSDDSGGVWVGMYGGGVAHRFVDGSWEVFDEDNSELPDNWVLTLLSDGAGGVWVGAYDVGLAHRFSDGSWEVFDTKNSDLPSDDIESFLSDGSGGIWVGTNFGLAHRFSDGSWEVFDPDDSDLPDIHLQTLVSDGSGGVWMGGESHGGLVHLMYSSGIIKEEQYLTGKRAAIIIAGGGNTDDNLLWDSTKKISNYTYKMLSKRGFSNTEIHYISSQNYADFNGDGRPDDIVDAPEPQRQLTTEDIQAAFEWAKKKGELNQPLYIFFTDHGGNNRLQLAEGVYIEAEELNAMLDDYQLTTGNKVILVIDACHSGTLVQSLAGPDRAIISSTDDGLAYFDRYEDQSFIYFVTKGLFKGMNFVEAFHYATSAQKKLLGKLSDYATVAGDEPGGFSQEPQYDDNGDGFYIVADEGEWLKEVTINGSMTMADITMMVEPVTQSGVISGLNSVHLKAQATLAAGEVKRVWAVIRPPQMDIVVDDTGIPLLAFPNTELNVSQTEENFWEGTWKDFVYNGEYEITFYAEDNEGNIESSDSIKLTVADGLECPPNGSVKINLNQEIYNPGDPIQISVTENLAYGYDLYVALVLPDGGIYTFAETNRMDQMINEWPDKWVSSNRNQGNEIVVLDDMTLLESFPKGQYWIYSILSPENQSILRVSSNWIWDAASFEMN